MVAGVAVLTALLLSDGPIVRGIRPDGTGFRDDGQRVSLRIAVVVIGVIVAGMLALIAWRRRNAQAD
jgi:heme/copper-type cytochrome/quinol oxidase subunit 2